MNTIFKPGMAVWDRIRFPGIQGTIDSICLTDKYPIKVRRFFDAIAAYTLDGRLYESDLPTLSVVDYEFKLPPQVIPHDFKKYDLILVRDSKEGLLELSIFDSLIQEEDLRYRTVYGDHWKYCIPFDQETYENQ